MRKRHQGQRPLAEEARGVAAGDQLDALNANTRIKRDPADAIRRRLEADIEQKARARRSHEIPASQRV